MKKLFIVFALLSAVAVGAAFERIVLGELITSVF